VLADAIWESLKGARADCCVPLGLMRTLTFRCCVVWSSHAIYACSWFSLLRIIAGGFPFKGGPFKETRKGHEW